MENIIDYAIGIDWLELGGLFFGLLAVFFLIKENILTWPSGIIYVLISFVIFFEAKLYADLALHFVFLVLNVYGWYYWIFGKKKDEEQLQIGNITLQSMGFILIASVLGIFVMGSLLKTYTDASLPYWDSSTTILSLSGMWLTARKKIENWYFWLVVDILATGIYVYKEIYFYAALYGIYIFMAIAGYLAWRKSQLQQESVG